MRLLKDSAVYVFGEVFAKAIPFILLPYLTRKLGLNGYGELANIQAFIILALVFVGLSQDGAITRYFYFYGKRSIGIVMSSGYIYSSLLTLFLLLLAFFIQNIILFYITLTAYSQTLLSVQLSLRQCQKKALGYVYLQIANGLLSMLLTFMLFELIAPKFEFRILSIILANSFSFLFGLYLYATKNKVKLFFSAKNRKLGFLYLFSFGLPLMFHQLSFFMKGKLDRIFIYEYFSPEELAIYAAGFQVASIFSVFLMALNKACVPYFYQKLKANEVDFSHIVCWMKFSFLLVIVPSLIAFIMPVAVYTVLLGEDFIGAKYYTVTFLLGLGLSLPYLLLVNYLFYYGENKKIALCTFFSSSCYIILVYSFIRLGLSYVPYALLISNIVLVISLYLVCMNIKVPQMVSDQN